MSQFSDNYLIVNQKMFPPKVLPTLRQTFDSLDDKDSQSIIQLTDLKDPTIALLFSIFAGGLGADRFYIGDIGLGIGKLLVGWLTLGIWWLVDLFLIMKATRQKNLEKISQVIASQNRI
jgi:TM2 domain-containing membrane protein YozV